MLSNSAPAPAGKRIEKVAGLLFAVRPARLQPCVDGVEIGSRLDDAFRGTLRAAAIFCFPEIGKGLIEGRWLLCDDGRHRQYKSDGATKNTKDTKPVGARMDAIDCSCLRALRGYRFLVHCLTS